MFNLQNLIRTNIQKLEAYSCARDEFKGEASVFLDANENSFGSPIDINLPIDLNRYPNSSQEELRERIAEYRSVNSKNVFLGVGSDEVIDLLLRIFCEPGSSNIIINPPTFGMYKVAASINNTQVLEVSLNSKFQLDIPKIIDMINDETKIIFICSPNNPTGNLMRKEDIISICQNFSGIIVVDEAYIDFAEEGKSMIDQIQKFPNLVILQTFSKAWGLAAIRLGVAFASAEIIEVLMKVKSPYNINSVTSYLALQSFTKLDEIKKNIKILLEERKRLTESLRNIPTVEKIFQSDSNFMLVQIKDAKKIYEELIQSDVVVRFREGTNVYEDSLRITVGTPEENKRLIASLKKVTVTKEKIIFIDRDGCIIVEPPAKPDDPDWVDCQVDSLDKLELLPGVIKALQEFVNDGYKLILISNQDGRGTDIFPEESFLKPHKEMLKVLRENGIEFEREFICPHIPEDDCECRKPKVGPDLRNYLEEVNIDMNESFMIGDRDSDMKFADNLRCRGLKISTNNEWKKITQIILNS